MFCSIAWGSAPGRPVLEAPQAIAFLDINPATDGHTLVVPRHHAEDIFDLDEETAAAVWQLTVAVARRLDEVLSPDGLTLFQANGAAGWQDVFHFHIHVVRRWRDDGLVRPWRHTPGDTGRLDEVAARLRVGRC